MTTSKSELTAEQKAIVKMCLIRSIGIALGVGLLEWLISGKADVFNPLSAFFITYWVQCFYFKLPVKFSAGAADEGKSGSDPNNPNSICYRYRDH